MNFKGLYEMLMLPLTIVFSLVKMDEFLLIPSYALFLILKIWLSKVFI